MNEIKIGYDLKMYREEDIRIPLRFDISVYTHVLLTGGSGSGKSYSIISILASIVKNCSDVMVYFCDFKNSEDFEFLTGYQFYFSGDKAVEGVLTYYKEFQIARNERNTKRHILIVDEYPSMLSYLQTLDKVNKTKVASDVMAAIAEILMLGRGICFGCLITTQRADSSLFASGSRDNFQLVIALGKLSKEQKTMLFAGEELPEGQVYQRGEGIIYADGRGIREVKFAKLLDVDGIKKKIFERLKKNSDVEQTQ